MAARKKKAPSRKKKAASPAPETNARVVRVRLQGSSDMLMHRPDLDTIDGTNKKTGEKDRSTYWRDVALYYDHADGKVFFPSTWIERSLMKAATDFKIKGKGNKTYKMLVQATVFVSEDKIYFDPEINVEDFLNEKNDQCSVDVRTVVNPSTRGRVPRQRPKFHAGWSVEFDLHCIDEEFPVDVLHQIVTHAGSRIGLGDYRPKFGRFSVSAFEIIHEFKTADEVASIGF